MSDINILAIESSCDETAAAVVTNGRQVRSNIIASQIDIHTLYGGVVPEIASRKHTECINGVVTRALTEAQNVAEAIYAADDVDGALAALDFRSAHGVWTRAAGDYTLYVEGDSVPTDAGELWQGSVRAFYSMRNADQARQEDEELFVLPCARYKGGQP